MACTILLGSDLLTTVLIARRMNSDAYCRLFIGIHRKKHRAEAVGLFFLLMSRTLQDDLGMFDRFIIAAVFYKRERGTVLASSWAGLYKNCQYPVISTPLKAIKALSTIGFLHELSLGGGALTDGITEARAGA